MTSFEKTAAMLNNMIPDLEKGLTKGKRVFRQTKRLAQGLTDVRERFKYFSDEFSKAKQAQKALEKLSKEFEAVKKVQDKFLEKIPGPADKLQKALKASSYLGGLMQIFLTVASMTILLKRMEANLLSQDKVNNRINFDLSKILGLIQLQKSRIDTANGQIYELKQQDQRNRDRIYKVEKDVPVVRAMANDALYEVRAGRQILENKITENQNKTEAARKLGNDALYEARAGRSILEEKVQGLSSFARNLLNNAKTDFQKSIDAAFKDVLKQVETANKNADKANKDTIAANTKINDINRIIAQIRAEIGGLKPGEPINIDKIKADIISRLTPEMQAYLRSITPGSLINFDIEKSRVDNLYDMDRQRKLQDARWKEIIDSLQPRNTYLDNFVEKLNQELAQFRERVKLNEEVAGGVAGAQERLNQRFQQDVKNLEAAWQQSKQGLASFTEALKKIETDQFNKRQQQLKDIDDKLKNNERKIAPFIQQVSKNEINKGLEPIKADLTNIKNDLNQKTRQIQTIDTQIKERIKVDERVERKIDSIIPTIAGIPLIVGRIPSQTTNLISPIIPTTPQIGNVVKDSVCNPKCQRPSISTINNVGNGIKDDLGQKIRDGNSALQSGALAEILRRLGEFIPGGISGKLVNGFKWLQLDRALNILTFAATVHNAGMLSQNILQTLVQAMQNVVDLFGLKDDNNDPINLSELINSSIQNAVKAVVGADNYESFMKEWNKLNRIYQAAGNLFSSLMNMGDTIVNALQVIGGQTGKIGNALRAWGAVSERAYQWFNPNPNFNNPLLTKLSSLEETASMVENVTQQPLNVKSAKEDLENNAKEMADSLAQLDGKPQGKEFPEASKVKKDQEEIKEASKGKDLNPQDLEADE